MCCSLTSAGGQSASFLPIQLTSFGDGVDDSLALVSHSMGFGPSLEKGASVSQRRPPFQPDHIERPPQNTPWRSLSLGLN
jgi:hypothetical protein